MLGRALSLVLWDVLASLVLLWDDGSIPPTPHPRVTHASVFRPGHMSWGRGGTAPQAGRTSVPQQLSAVMLASLTFGVPKACRRRGDSPCQGVGWDITSFALDLFL